MVLFAAAAGGALVVQARDSSTQEARQLSKGVAQSFARAPGTLDGMKSGRPTALLQPRAEDTRKNTGVDYVVAFDPQGFRWTHPDPGLIGKHVYAEREGAAADRPFTKTFEGSLGLAVDTTVPVYDTNGIGVVGFVSVGVTVASVDDVVQDQLPQLLGFAGGALAVAAGGTALVSWRLRRQTRGLDPSEMTRMYEHHDAVLHAVREGVLIIGGDGRLLLANDEARRLLDLPDDAEERRVGDLGLEAGTAALLGSGRPVTDVVHLAGDRLLAVNVRPVDPDDRPAGSVATLRDTTELRALAGRAEVARERLGLLYEAGVRIGTTLDVVRTAQELAEVAVPRFADAATVDLLDPILRGAVPAGPGPGMRRVAVHGADGVRSLYPVGELIRFVPTSPAAVGAERGRAVLDVDLAAPGGWMNAQDPARARRVLDLGFHSLITVPLRARGVVLGMASFWRAGGVPFGAEDLAFAEELAARAAVAVDNARRYTREHTLAETLQRSLLPGSLPDHAAVEVAHRYLPALEGVGGDWFDVIPLPGARVALVVGDVVGHGLHAAATMGRLRTAVHNFSALDLPPDELLGHLDELVARIDDDRDGDGKTERDSESVSGATCLYAIYDPASGMCSLARSGHPEPALVHPDGTVEFLRVPGSPPLGLGGGLPFETAERALPEGSRLVLYTDGLIEDRERGIDSGLEALRDALAHSGRAPEETCRDVLDAVLPARSSDDIALLVARTRLLDPSQVAEWDVPGDPAVVAGIRAEVTGRLRTWGLEEMAFTTELIISELVTNAIRYGIEPIRLRVLHDGDSLICEVADGSSTSPHLRRAATTDEGGRGLFLVAQFARRWGTRYMARGKVIWTEQSTRSPVCEPEEVSAEALLDQWEDAAW
ncbi:SpoIIE family protein phosphatase [Streptomyces sp. 378]|uniref:SpoIIE family protein phosphatase n=1 Tax=Streptomyces sp. 378 TaxID=3049412 RepID=UPI0024C3548C|nr:SpoIIE family protein phosphatase/ATP-binding protein [Streptomyces sp. 378]MDK1344521.1 SpoIIE family protein phosphatase [Streptomyces sp. 378]